MVTTQNDSEHINLDNEASKEATALIEALSVHLQVIVDETVGRSHAQSVQWGIEYLSRNGFGIPSGFPQLLREAREDVEVKAPYHNQPLKLASSRGAWGSLLINKKMNVVVAAPKVGKSALMLHLYACARRGDETCLGKPIRKPWNKLIIAGSDMDASQWGKMLCREGLATCTGDLDSDNAEFIPCDDVILWPLDNPVKMNATGLVAMREACLKYPDSFLIIDSLRSSMDSSIDENKAEVRGPIQDTKFALADCDVTIALIHHANKSVSGSTAVNAAAGSNAIAGSCDGTLLLRYLVPDAAVESLRTDFRVLAVSSGRLQSDNALIELTRTGIGEWFHHEDLELELKKEAIYAMEEKLTSRQERVYEHACELAENNVYITTSEAKRTLNLTVQQARKSLEQLTRKGLLIRCGFCDEAEGMGRPAARYAPTLSDLARMRVKMNKTRVFSINKDSSTSSNPSVLKTPDMPPLRARDPIVLTPPTDPIPHPLKSPVEILVDNEWQTGWVLDKRDNPHNVQVQKLGMPSVVKSSLRWDFDVRLDQVLAARLADPLDVAPEALPF